MAITELEQITDLTDFWKCISLLSSREPFLAGHHKKGIVNTAVPSMV